MTGELIINYIDHLYHSYSPWIFHYPENFKRLSLIKKVAEISLMGGNYITSAEEQKVLTHLRALRDDLCYGKLRQNQVPEVIQRILTQFLDENPKAKLVASAAQLERAICQEERGESHKNVHQVFARVIQKVNPGLPDRNANSAAKEFTRLLHRASENPEALIPVIEKTIKDLL